MKDLLKKQRGNTRTEEARGVTRKGWETRRYTEETKRRKAEEREKKGEEWRRKKKEGEGGRRREKEVGEVGGGGISIDPDQL